MITAPILNSTRFYRSEKPDALPTHFVLSGDETQTRQDGGFKHGARAGSRVVECQHCRFWEYRRIRSVNHRRVGVCRQFSPQLEQTGMWSEIHTEEDFLCVAGEASE